MKIGILGAGRMGTTLARNLSRIGHDVVLGSRRPGKPGSEAESGKDKVRLVSYRDAVQSSDVIILATLWADTRDAIAIAGPFGGKILVDCTNPESADAMSLVLSSTTSGAEEIAGWAVDARVVKAFNHVYAEIIETRPRFGSETGTAFYCGDDVAAKAVVSGLAKDLGLDPVDAGPLKNSRYLEPLAQLMVQLVRAQAMGPDNVAIKLLRRQPIV